MIDIVERLRSHSGTAKMVSVAELHEAATEIERLRGEIEHAWDNGYGRERTPIEVLSDLADRLEAEDHPAYEAVCTALGVLGRD
jgi:hypothetical protein